MFYTVVRQFFKGAEETHSMEVKQTLQEAMQRYFNIIAADLGTPDITWQFTAIIDSNGQMLEGRVFDRRTVDAEQEG